MAASVHSPSPALSLAEKPRAALFLGGAGSGGLCARLISAGQPATLVTVPRGLGAPAGHTG